MNVKYYFWDKFTQMFVTPMLHLALINLFMFLKFHLNSFVKDFLIKVS